MIYKKERDKSVDFAKGVAMIAVSFGHIMPNLCGKMDNVSKFCYSFELAVFFIVSGYLQFERTERKPLEYIKHNVVSLLYPYIMFTLASSFVDSILHIASNGFFSYFNGLPLRICTIITWGIGACWFLPTFFISGIIAYFCRRDKKIPIIIKTSILIIIGSTMSATAEKYGYLKEVTDESIFTGLFYLWHLFSFMARSIIRASLILMGFEIKWFVSKKIKNLGGVLHTICRFDCHCHYNMLYELWLHRVTFFIYTQPNFILY